MRINTNVSALNAANNLSRTQMDASESMAKLSSGFRINKAADDAAGLGIANKLRADTRALSQASRNAEQTNSLLQVAEGSTSTIQKMLERMKELATQSGSDSVDQGGRDRIASEFTALRSEISRTVSTTKFQGNALLDGSFGLTANELKTSDVSLASASTAAAGTYKFTVSNGVVSLDKGTTNIGTVTVASIAASSYDAVAGKVTLDFGSGANKISVAVAASSATDAASITAGLDGKAFGITAGAVVHTSNLDATALGKGITAGATAASVTAGNYHVAVVDASATTSLASQTYVTGLSANTASGTDASYVMRVINGRLDVYASTDLAQTTSLAGAALAVDGTATAIASTAAGTALGFGATAFTVDATVAAVNTKAKIATEFDGKTITVTGATIELQQGIVGAGTTPQGAIVKLGAFTDGISKLSSLNVGGIAISSDNMNAGGNTYANLKATLNATEFEVGNRGTAGSTTTAGSVTGNSTVKQASFLVDASGSYKSSDVVKLTALNLSTTALGIDAVDLSSASGALDGLTKIDSAISTVSSALGSIGANQNRIGYAQDNLKTKIANFSAAESVIRDVDMADEMTKFSKSNILAQAGTAMLAQANQAAQGVLQLLRG